MSIHKILVADDDELLRTFLKNALSRKNFEVQLAKNGQEALQLLQNQDFDLLITDLKMPELNGLELLKSAKQADPDLMVIMVTAHGSVENAVEAIKAGAFNYLIKPFSLDALETLIEKAQDLQKMLKENLFFREENQKSSQLLTYSPYLAQKAKDLEKIAKSEASVLITGESGTGKEVIASCLHALSKRSNKPFIKVNCAAIPESLIEAEFFGHEKGAFTGAEQKRIGRFELADGGTLLLDEISEIPLALQAKLLRVLQEMEFERIGSSKPLRIDVRIIATSNRDLKAAINKKLFREDLFFRLNVVPFHLPPLKERRKDILPLARYFLQKFSHKYNKKHKIFLPDSEEKLLNYPWPGNIRELSNILERTVVLDRKEQISPQDLFLDIAQEHKTHKKNSLADILEKAEKPIIKSEMENKEQIENSEKKYQTIAEMEKKLILRTLQEQNYAKNKTAKILGISERTLRYKLKSYSTDK